MRPTLRRTTVSLVIAGLLLGSVGLAQAHARRGIDGWLPGPAGSATSLGRLPAALPLIAGLPLGTTVEARFHDADPAEGAAAVVTLVLTVGVDSEAAFARALADAREQAEGWDAAYLVVVTGERTRTVVLPAADAEEAAQARRAWGALALRLPTAGMADGDTIAVALYDADPAAGGAVLQTLTFTYGSDSAIGFRANLAEALEGAAAAVVTTSPRSVTIDLHAAATATERMRERVGAMAERFPALAGRLRDHLDGRWGAGADDGRRPAMPMRPGMPGRR